jgi:chorismate mutase/prephenate dehydratase
MSDDPKPQVVYLGPKYTFSHEAATHMYPHAELFYKKSFKEVFKAVRTGEMDYGVLPVENSSTGAIMETCQLLVEQDFEPITGAIKVQIVKEFYLPVRLNLLARQQMSIADVKTLYTHRQPELQCVDFLGQYMPHAKRENTVSTADAAERLLQDATGACIGSDVLAREHKLVTIQEGIQDVYRNVTRFVGLSAKHEAIGRAGKTTLAIIIPDKPGTLVETLQMLSAQGINLRNIKTLPIRDSRLFSSEFKDWFVLDIESSDACEKYKHFIKAKKERSDLILCFKPLGSYPVFTAENRNAAKHPPKPKKAPPTKQESLLALLHQTHEGESDKVEFKSTLRFNLRSNSADKELPKAVAKAICAFMNAEGGTLFIGVGDHKEPIGIDRDIQGLSKKDEDGFVSTLFQLVVDMLGTEYCQLVHPTIMDYQDKRICAVQVDSSTKPAWYNDGNVQTFFVRAGNASRPFSPKEALDYILRKFKGMGVQQ